VTVGQVFVVVVADDYKEIESVVVLIAD